MEGRGRVRGGAWEGQGGPGRATVGRKGDRLGGFHTQTTVQRGVSHHAPNLPLTVPKKSNSHRPESTVAPSDAAF